MPLPTTVRRQRTWLSWPWPSAASARPDLARATLSRLREAMKKPNWAEDEESQSLLLEAEAIDLDVVFPADSFAIEIVS